LVVSRTASGNNVFNGMSGNDTLLGFGGNDWLGGGSGNDSLNGGAGQDLISGGIGTDTLAGGPDADTFQFVSQYETAGSDPSGIDYANTDVIPDFNPAHDTIDVHYVDANVGIPGDQDFDFIGEYFAAGGFTASGQAAYFNDGTIPTSSLTPTPLQAASWTSTSPSGSQGGKTPEASWFHL
jgi:Ca2+-binding RTX toxin-like protein